MRIKYNLEPREDGMIGRECPNETCQPKYFKVSQTIPDELVIKYSGSPQIMLTCPYCGTREDNQQFFTKEQIEWAHTKIKRDFMEGMQAMLQRATKQNSSGSLQFRASPLPNVRYYVEEKIEKIITCDNCSCKYAVYGLSFHCPICSQGNLLLHIKSSSEIIKVLIGESDRIGHEKGTDIGRHLLCNALEDVVGLYEGFLKYIYKYSVSKLFTAQEARGKLERIRTNMQNIDKSIQLFQDDCRINIFDGIDMNDKEFLQEQFFKRHVITHNLGLIDERYNERAQVIKRQGVNIDISPQDIMKALAIVEAVVSVALKGAVDVG